MAAGDLTTLAKVRARLQKGDSDTSQDPLIEDLIEEVSATIRRDYGVFASETDATHTFTYAGGGFLALSPYRLRSATRVVLDSDLDEAEQTALTLTTDYALRPANSDDGVYTWLSISSSYTTSSGPRQVAITGDWGYEEIPADVRSAATISVIDWLRQDVSSYARTFNLEEGRVDRPQKLPSRALGMLADYAPVVLA